MWIDLIVEYTAGFAFGLFIFQALFMKGMMGGTYPRAVRSSFIPEWFSMNMMAAGMFPVMIFLMMGRDMRAMEPTEPLFWGVMSLGVIVGFFTAYPVNVWMVSRNLKHGLMTARPPSGSVAEPECPAAPARRTRRPASRTRLSRDGRTVRMEKKAQNPTLTMAHTDAASVDGHAGHEDHAAMGHSGQAPRDETAVTRPQLAVVGMLTVLALAPAFSIPARLVNLTYSAEDVGGVVMPPGMVMTPRHPGRRDARHGRHRPGRRHLRSTRRRRAATSRSNRESRTGYKVFDLGISVIELEHPARPERRGLRLQPPGAGAAHPRHRGRQGAHQRHQRPARSRPASTGTG